MKPFVIFDILALIVFSYFSLKLCFSRQIKIRFSSKVFLIFLGLCLTFHSLSNSLEWTGVTAALDPFEDYIEILIPMFYGFFIYAYMQYRVEADLYEREKKYRMLFETANDAIIIINPATGNIVDANRKAELLFGLSYEEIRGLPQTALHPKGSISFYENLFKSSAEVAGGHVDTAIAVNKDGLKIPVQISSSLIELQGERMVLGIYRDISDFKKIEESLRSDRDSLQKIIHKRSIELERIQKSIENVRHLSEIGVLAATVAHELRNPLNVIRTAIFNIKKKRKETSLDSHILNIERKVMEGEQIIRNMLSYAKIKMPNFKLIKPVVLVNDCIEIVKDKYVKKQVDVQLHYNSVHSSPVELDPIQIQQVFLNILDNAYQALEDKKGKIEININFINTKNIVIVEFNDNGVGIKGEDIEHVFEPFYTTKAKGTGLGLSVCNKLVELHSGNISIKSKVGQKTSVIVTLPIKHTHSPVS